MDGSHLFDLKLHDETGKDVGARLPMLIYFQVANGSGRMRTEKSGI